MDTNEEKNMTDERKLVSTLETKLTLTVSVDFDTDDIVPDATIREAQNYLGNEVQQLLLDALDVDALTDMITEATGVCVKGLTVLVN